MKCIIKNILKLQKIMKNNKKMFTKDNFGGIINASPAKKGLERVFESRKISI